MVWPMKKEDYGTVTQEKSAGKLQEVRGEIQKVHLTQTFLKSFPDTAARTSM